MSDFYRNGRRSGESLDTPGTQQNHRAKKKRSKKFIKKTLKPFRFEANKMERIFHLDDDTFIHMVESLYIALKQEHTIINDFGAIDWVFLLLSYVMRTFHSANNSINKQTNNTFEEFFFPVVWKRGFSSYFCNKMGKTPMVNVNVLTWRYVSSIVGM